MYFLDHKSKKALYIQLYEELKKDIIQNFNPGDKMSSLRSISTMYKLSKNTVEQAYSQLVVEGYIENIPRSGFFVTQAIYDDFNLTYKTKHEKSQRKNLEYLYDFYYAKLEKTTFPLNIWKKLSSEVLKSEIDFGAYTQAQGEEGLRHELASYLNTSRAVKCTYEQIFVCAGFSDSMQMVSKILHKSHESFAMEKPGYFMAKKAFEEDKYKITKIALDEESISISELYKSKATVVYVTPAHQNPTGKTMSIKKRMELLSWANDVNGIIIEDDYDSELCYYNRPIPSLQGLDTFGRVIYLGTFSKALSPALRTSYMVLPKRLHRIYQSFFSYHFSKVSLITQKTLELFMGQGHWEKHIRKMRSYNKKKHNLLKKLIHEKLGDTVRIESQGAGLAININPTGKMNYEKLKNLAEQEKIKLYFVQEECEGDWSAIRMGFGGMCEQEIKEAMEVFCQIWYDALDK